MAYSTTDILTWGKICQPLAAIGEANKQSFNNDDTADLDLHIKIYDAVQSLDWEYAQDPSSSYLYKLGDYVLALCGVYLLKAQQISVDGGLVVITTTPESGTSSNIAFYVVKGGDFTNATDYTNTDLIGKDISVFLQNYNRYLEDDEYVLLAGGIVRIFGFDSTAYTIGKIIMRVDVNGTAPVSTIVDAFPYDLTEVTVIPNMPSGASYQSRRVIIRPNGFTYTWGSQFEFNDSWPEQPAAIDAGTVQIYEFTYDPTTGKDVCSNQTINAAS